MTPPPEKNLGPRDRDQVGGCRMVTLPWVVRVGVVLLVVRGPLNNFGPRVRGKILGPREPVARGRRNSTRYRRVGKMLDPRDPVARFAPPKSRVDVEGARTEGILLFPELVIYQGYVWCVFPISMENVELWKNYLQVTYS